MQSQIDELIDDLAALRQELVQINNNTGVFQDHNCKRLAQCFTKISEGSRTIAQRLTQEVEGSVRTQFVKTVFQNAQQSLPPPEHPLSQLPAFNRLRQPGNSKKFVEILGACKQARDESQVGEVRNEYEEWISRWKYSIYADPLVEEDADNGLRDRMTYIADVMMSGPAIQFIGVLYSQFAAIGSKRALLKILPYLANPPPN